VIVSARAVLSQGKRAWAVKAVSAARAKVTAAAPPCVATRRIEKDGASAASPLRLAARMFAVNQASPTLAVTAARPNAIHASVRLCTSV
jgi:hypothetical protein